MPCIGARDQVELPPGVLPRFEGGDLHRNAAAAGNVSHPLVRVDAEDRQTAPCQSHGGFAGAAPNIEHVHRLKSGKIVGEAVRRQRHIRRIAQHNRAGSVAQQGERRINANPGSALPNNKRPRTPSPQLISRAIGV
jgi:hypothetical protein